jgi:cystathionine beta-lyase
MLGSITAAPGAWEPLNRTVRQWGTAVSPDDAWLALRGLRTLDVRLRRHEQNALAVAGWLTAQPRVRRVLHPALPTCPGHQHFARDFAGSTGLFAVVLDSSTAARDRFIDRLQLFGIGWSWGGFESLASPVDLAGLRSVGRPLEGPTVRLHIGLEDPADLIADLAQALA